LTSVLLFYPLVDSPAIIRFNLKEWSEDINFYVFERISKLGRLLLDSFLNHLRIIVYLANEVFAFLLNIAPFAVRIDVGNIFFNLFKIEQAFEPFSHPLNLGHVLISFYDEFLEAHRFHQLLFLVSDSDIKVIYQFFLYGLYQISELLDKSFDIFDFFGPLLG
jgi:hypothetical protein